MKTLKVSLVILFCWSFLLACGPAFKSTFVTDFRFVNSASKDLVPSTDQVDSACMTSAAYDACIYMKNPVAQTKAAIASDSDYVTRQTFGVKITDTDQTGFLQNSNYQVLPLRGTRLQLLLPGRKTVFSSANSNVEQVMAYYWLTRAWAHLTAQMGSLPSDGKALQVYVGAPRSGWSAKDKSIYLADTNHVDLSAEVLTSLWGEANLYFASAGKSTDLTGDSNHVACSNDMFGCCTTLSGCSRAIQSGVGDYFALVAFQDFPQVGEMIANATSGQVLCGNARNVTTFANLTAQTVYASCAGQAGWTPSLGFLYASIWWQVRSRASEASAVDRLFLRHMQGIVGTDTFASVKTKILNLAPSFGADLSALFTTEFTKRGL
jgi:hypothetical protein